jgi:DNA-binding CsgD family transcriptional regulator
MLFRELKGSARPAATHRRFRSPIIRGIDVRNKNIAKQLQISPTTVNNHIQHILKKLNAHTRLEALRRAERAGLI